MFYYDKGKREFMLVGEKKVKAFEEALANKHSGNVLKGQSAYPGKAQGKVRIVMNPQINTVFEDGEILVTGMTRPEYLPFVDRCAAFITDAGGLLSHAAITARELEKPCVIGTQIATTFLKDGDLVEVDADNGVVKVLET